MYRCSVYSLLLALIPLLSHGQIQFTGNYEDLGTTETTTLRHGQIEVIAPVDQEDVARRLFPVLDQYVAHRQQAARQEAEAILSSLPALKRSMREFIREAYGDEAAGAPFDAEWSLTEQSIERLFE